MDQLHLHRSCVLHPAPQALLPRRIRSPLCRSVAGRDVVDFFGALSRTYEVRALLAVGKL